MYRRRISFMTMCVAILAAFCLGGCRQDELRGKTEKLSDGLYLQLTTSDEGHEMFSSRAGESSDALREGVVSTLDVFIVDHADGSVVKYSHIEGSSISEGKAEVISGDWKTQLPKDSYDFYVLANYKGDAALGSIKQRDELISIKVKDMAILRAEGEKYGLSDPPSTEYKGKLFTMSGRIEAWNPTEQDNQAVVTVQLVRNAAKIVINLSYDKGFTDGVSRLDDLRKTLVNYAVTADAFSSSIPADAELGGRPALDGNEDQSLSNNVEGSGITRKETLYFYTYPTDWSGDLMRETYVLLNIPYYDKNNGSDKINNYYKIPLRVSTSAADLKLSGNTEYTYTVTVNRVGNKEIDAPVELNVQSVTKAEWKEKKVDFGNEKPAYLITSADRIDITESMISAAGGLGKASFTFTSGSTVKNVILNKAYYVNKDQTQVENLNGKALKDNCSFEVKYDDETTHRSGTVEVTINGGVPANLASHHFEFLLENENGLSKTVRVSLRPEIYVTPLQGIMSTRTNLATQFDVVATSTSNPVQISMKGQKDGNYETANYIFYPRLAQWDSGNPRNFYKIKWVSMGGGYPPRYILAADNAVSDARSEGNTNMFVVVMSQIPKSISEYEDMIQYGIGRYTPNQSGNPTSDNNLISPMFIIASELGTTSGFSSFNEAYWQAAEYVEVAATNFITGYGLKPTNYRELKGWRLPTKGELALIAKLQIFPNQDVIDKTLQFKEESAKPYYTCYKSNNFYVSKIGTVEETSTGLGSVRCVRDVSREELDDWIQAGLIK